MWLTFFNFYQFGKLGFHPFGLVEQMVIDDADPICVAFAK